jgi:hypothetical protein
MFGGTFTNRRLDTDNLTQVIAEATLAGEWSPEIRDALTALVSKVALRERAFADAMSSLSVGISSAVEQGHAKDLKEARQAFLAALSSPNALVLASEVIAAQSASMAGLSVPEGLVRARAPMLLESFATTVHFMIRLLRKGLESEVNWHGKPHCNSAWDLLISFHVTSRVKVNSLPVLLVSDDGDIRSAAVAAGWGEFVVPRNRYFDLLSTGGIVAYAGVLQARAA